MAAVNKKRSKRIGKPNGYRYTPADREAHVRAFRESGLSQVKYSAKAKVSSVTLSKWLKAAGAPVKPTGRATGTSGRFERGPVLDLARDAFFESVKETPLSVEEQNQRLRIAIKAMARML